MPAIIGRLDFGWRLNFKGVERLNQAPYRFW